MLQKNKSRNERNVKSDITTFYTGIKKNGHSARH